MRGLYKSLVGEKVKKFEVDRVYIHSNIGRVKYTKACDFIQQKNPDNSSIFMESMEGRDEGEILEITKSCIHEIK